MRFGLTRWVISATNMRMRIALLCAQPEVALDDAASVATALVDLGCHLLLGPLGAHDLGPLRAPDGTSGARPPHSPPDIPLDILIVDAGDNALAARTALEALGNGPLADVPKLLAITVPRLAALDFSAGFDDFVLLPVVQAELYARLRQLDWRTATFGSDERIKVDDLVIDIAGYEAYLHGRRLDFTHQEFELLRFLAHNRGRVFTRDQLLERVWGYRYAGGSRTVDIHVRRIRAKLGAAPGGLIETVRNVGYKMRAARPTPEAEPEPPPDEREHRRTLLRGEVSQVHDNSKRAISK
jgi:DNA-binding response OmpR family regulator